MTEVMTLKRNSKNRAATLISAAVVGCALWSAAPARASLMFTTAGGFTGTDAIPGGDLLFNDITGTAVTEVSFSGPPAASLPIPGTYPNQDFGLFTVATTGDVGIEYLKPGDTFNVEVLQSSPSNSSTSINSTLISGTVIGTSGAMFVQFTPGSDSISFDGGAEKYIFNDITPITIDSHGNGTASLTGTVVATPSPSSAVGGVIFCGLFFLGRPRKNRFVARR